MAKMTWLSSKNACKIGTQDSIQAPSEVFMFRKAILISTLGLFAAATIAVAPANAVTNGQSCPKAGAKMTTKGKKYTCAKNPYVLPTRLTWTSATCLSTQREYLDYVSQEEDLKGMAVGLVGASLDEANKLIKEVADLNVQIQARLKNVICKRGK